MAGPPTKNGRFCGWAAVVAFDWTPCVLPRGSKPAMFMRCAVMHVRPLADGLFVVGVEFVGTAEMTDGDLAGGKLVAADKLAPAAAAAADAVTDAEVKRARQVILS